MREFVRSHGRDRRVLVALGVALVFVPTAFGVFVEWTEWPTSIRAVVLIGWAAVAAFIVWGSVIQGERLEQFVGQRLTRRGERRRLTASRLLPMLLRYGTALPEHYQLRLFVYDEDQQRLITTFDPDDRPSAAGWKPGQGATGVAWDLGEYVLVQGGAVSDGTYGLNSEQQEKYRHLAVVGAMPVKDDHAEVIGVLTASGTDDDGRLASPGGQNELQELAIVVARVLIEFIGEDD